MGAKRQPASQVTRGLVFDAVRSAGTISRVELAAFTGFTEATISTTVRDLLADDLVREVGHSESTGGKRRRLLSVNPKAYVAVGLALDHEQLSYVVTDLSGTLIANLLAPGTGDAPPHEVLKRIAREIRALLHDAVVDPERVVGLGVATPGPIDGEAGRLRGGRPFAAWNDFPFREVLSGLLAMPVVVDNDASCAALGEHWIARRPTSRVSATVYMADGIGSGVLMDGKVFRGTSGNAGEIGHVSVDSAGPMCSCGMTGCVEVLAGPLAVVRAASRDPALAARLQLEASSPRQGFAAIRQEAARNDPASLALLTESARYLALGAVALANMLDLDEIILSGPGFASVGGLYSTVMQDHLDRLAYARGVHRIEVSMSTISNQAAAAGSASLVMQHHVLPHRPAPGLGAEV